MADWHGQHPSVAACRITWALPIPLSPVLSSVVSPEIPITLCIRRVPTPSEPPLALGFHTSPYGLHYKTSLQHTAANEAKKQASPNGLLCNLSAPSRCWSLICIYFWPKQQYRIIIFKWPDSHGGGWRPLLISSPCLVSFSSS